MLEINSELAARINEEARRDPQSPYVGKFVGIANGQLMVVADDLDTAIRRLRQIEPKLLLATDSYRYNGKVHDRAAVVDELLSQLATVQTVLHIQGPFAAQRPVTWRGRISWDGAISVEAAMSIAHSVSCCPTNCWRPRERVAFVSSFR